MVAKAVEWIATPEDAGGQWERKVKATKEDPEQVGLDPVERGEEQSGERGGQREDSSLRQQQQSEPKTTTRDRERGRGGGTGMGRGGEYEEAAGGREEENAREPEEAIGTISAIPVDVPNNEASTGIG